MYEHAFTPHALSADSSLSAAVGMMGVVFDKKFTVAPAAVSGRVHLTPADTRRRIVAPSIIIISALF